MLKLYYRPMACSLASRMALMQGGLDAEYLPVDFITQISLSEGKGFGDISAKKRVPVLILPGGEKITENAAVLQYIADQAPGSGLAPAPGNAARYRLQEWLSFIGTEFHKAILFPYFRPETEETTRKLLLRKTAEPLAYLADELGEEFLMGEDFTVADAYLLWTLLLLRFAGAGMPDRLAEYVRKGMSLDPVAAAVATERAELENFPPRKEGAA